MISLTQQRVKIKKTYFYNFYIIMSAFYTFLSNLYNCLLKFISLIILLGEMLKISGEVRCHPQAGAHLPHLPPNSGLAFKVVNIHNSHFL